MSAVESLAVATTRPVPLRFGTIIVVGGGCYGGYYVRQLERAVRARAVSVARIVVVDRAAECAVAHRLRGEAARESEAPPVEIVVSEWAAYFDAYLSAASDRRLPSADDAIVPSPLMPHLMGDWLVARVKARSPSRRLDVVPLDREPSIPWRREAPDGTTYLSFAEWTCPINCIEPALCPELGTPRTWSMPRRLREYAAAESARTGTRTVPLVLQCRHRTFGVGMFDTADVLNAEAAACDAVAAGSVDLLIGTVSHCHGALRRVRVA